MESILYNRNEWERRGEGKITNNWIELRWKEFPPYSIRGRVVQYKPHDNNRSVVQAKDIKIIRWQLDSSTNLGHCRYNTL